MADYNNLVKVKRQSGKMSILEVTGVAEEKVRERAMEYGEVIWICQNPVRLQSYGFAPTVQAKHLIAGDILRHNYGIAASEEEMEMLRTFETMAEVNEEIASALRNAVGVDLSNCYLGYADFFGRDLSGANFSGSRIPHINMRNADLRGADFTNADLSWADLGYADMRGANLEGAKLEGANLADVRWS